MIIDREGDILRNYTWHDGNEHVKFIGEIVIRDLEIGDLEIGD